MAALVAWLNEPIVLRWLFAIALVTMLMVVVLVPVVVAALPTDYFARQQREQAPWMTLHPLLWMPLMALKNLAGLLCVLAGVLMLVLPGQGVLTILLGLMLLDFPGKYRVERWLVMRPVVWGLFNRIRARRGKPPLMVHDNGRGDG